MTVGTISKFVTLNPKQQNRTVDKFLAAKLKGQKGEISEEVKNTDLQKNNEIILFQNRENVAKLTPVITVVSKPVREQAEAAAIGQPSNNNIWAKHNIENFTNNNLGSLLSGETEISSALTKPENNKGSDSDKHDDGNTFLLAGKNILDLRKEQLEDDNIINIMGGIC